METHDFKEIALLVLHSMDQWSDNRCETLSPQGALNVERSAKHMWCYFLDDVVCISLKLTILVNTLIQKSEKKTAQPIQNIELLEFSN